MTSEAPESRCSWVPLDVGATLMKETWVAMGLIRSPSYLSSSVLTWEGRKKTRYQEPGEVVCPKPVLSIGAMPSPLVRAS